MSRLLKRHIFRLMSSPTQLHIGVLSRNMEYWTTRKIIKAGRLKGHETDFVNTRDVQLRVDDVYFDAFHGTKSFRETDVVIPRIGRSLTDFGVLLLNQLALMNVPTTLSPAGLSTARNKFATMQKLRAAGLRIPESFLVASKIKAGDVIERSPPPLILKLLSGTQGVGVMKVEKVSDVGPIIDTLVELKQLILIQSYIPNPGEDMRMFVVGDEVVGAMTRKASPNEWRSNIHLGGTGEFHRQTEVEAEMAIKAAKAVGVEIAGVDMITSKEGPYVIEVNASPGFKGLMKATDVDVPGLIVDYAVGKARR
jgi:ribosomal protein S6--L-glutamate ligase